MMNANVQISLYSTDPKIIFSRTKGGLGPFDSSEYTAALTGGRASREEVDHALKQFSEHPWKVYLKLVLAFLFLLLLVPIGMPILDNPQAMPTIYIDEYAVRLMIPMFFLSVQIIFFGTLRLIHRIGHQAATASKELMQRINADFASKDLTWQRSASKQTGDQLFLWKGYKAVHLISFGTAGQLDSSFYMPGMTDDRITYEQVDEVTRTIKTSLTAMDKKYERVCLCLGLLFFNVMSWTMALITAESADHRSWPGSVILAIFLMSLFPLTICVAYWLTRSHAEKKMAAVWNILEHFNPQFKARGFMWHISSENYDQIQLRLHHETEDRSDPMQRPRTGAAMEFFELD